MPAVVHEPRDAGAEAFHVLVMRFYGIGRLAFDVNLYGTRFDKYAVMTFGLTEFRIQKTDRRGKPREGSALFPTSSTWSLEDIRSSGVFQTPWWISATIGAGQYPAGLLLDMGESGWNLALFAVRFDSLVQAFGSRGEGIDKTPRKLTPLVIRREDYLSEHEERPD
ncbi:MAG: hypothetical protein P4L20_17400 [Acidimicrobiales bacterium]|nr:hypothetical protein [Acidimicrobiales bacterium]